MRRGRVVEDTDTAPYRTPVQPSAAQLQDALAEATRAGFQSGFERGQAEGRAALDKERAVLIARLSSSLETLHTAEANAVAETKRKIVDLALLIASRIVRERIETGDPLATRIAEELLARAGRGGTRTVRVHADDLPAITAICSALTEAGDTTVVADPRVDRGGIILESKHEELDARIATQLGIYYDALQERE